MSKNKQKSQGGKMKNSKKVFAELKRMAKIFLGLIGTLSFIYLVVFVIRLAWRG